MEDVLDHYERDYSSRYPVLCFDERPCQLIDDVLTPVPVSPGKSRREDYEYKRKGTCCVFMAIEPKTGKRVVEVSHRRTKADDTRFMKKVAFAYRGVSEITLIQDNLNTHNPSSFYENLGDDKAFDLMRRFKMVYTPRHASWLNMAEIEFSALSRQCLEDRGYTDLVKGGDGLGQAEEQKQGQNKMAVYKRQGSGKIWKEI